MITYGLSRSRLVTVLSSAMTFSPSIASILEQTEHRPFPLLPGPWVMEQTWRNLLFAHWRLDPAYLRPMIPPQIELETFDGSCWVSVTPFYMTGVRGRGLPPLPGLSRFAELNVRTYVRFGDIAGVYFFSLDCSNLPAIAAARMAYGLPYLYSRMSVEARDGRVNYICRRIDVDRFRPGYHGNASPDPELPPAEAVFRAQYWPTSPVFGSVPGSLEHFLSERYCLYAVLRGRVYRAQIHHLKWPLQAAEAAIEENTMALADGVRLPEDPPILHFSRELRVLIWWPERADR